jgi:small subunit ribosomal protein S1
MIEEKDNTLNEEQSFAELFAQTPVKRDYLKPGQKIEATIVKIANDWIFIDLGGKHEGYLDRKELMDDEGNLLVKEGDAITAYFLSSKHNEKLFTTKIGAGDSARNHMEEVWKSGIPIEGVVEKEVKGGFEVKLAGNMRGFCPFSQMALQRIENAQDYVGRRTSFRITQFSEQGRNIILSARVLLEEQRKKDEEALKAILKEGMVVKGNVMSIKPFGAFLDIGGIQGLLPISEIGWDRVEDINGHLSVGQTLDVAITKLDWEKNRISLSLKATLADPWNEAVGKYPEGSSHTGTIVRLTAFGAFVNLGTGVDGLIHISKLGKGKRILHPRDVVQVGDAIAVKVDSVDREQRKISLSPVVENEETEANRPAKEPADDYRAYMNKAPTSMGSFADLMKRKSEKKKK